VTDYFPYESVQAWIIHTCGQEVFDRIGSLKPFLRTTPVFHSSITGQWEFSSELKEWVLVVRGKHTSTITARDVVLAAKAYGFDSRADKTPYVRDWFFRELPQKVPPVRVKHNLPSRILPGQRPALPPATLLAWLKAYGGEMLLEQMGEAVNRLRDLPEIPQDEEWAHRWNNQNGAWYFELVFQHSYFMLDTRDILLAVTEKSNEVGGIHEIIRNYFFYPEAKKPLPTLSEWIGEEKLKELGKWASKLREQPVPGGPIEEWKWEYNTVTREWILRSRFYGEDGFARSFPFLVTTSIHSGPLVERFCGCFFISHPDDKTLPYVSPQKRTAELYWAPEEQADTIAKDVVL
jgi:hypothetical protein